ncbi:MAG: enoyl-CoA hydratase/isomerase family protein [Bdellovibrionales bacterium]|nr:enoyl-CoA hydratase/isomerase family protein [Bdellovibrionales bacterium]
MTNDNSPVQLERSDQHATIWINRPDALNALNEEALRGLAESVQSLAKLSPSERRVVLVRGRGEKSFVAGADIKLMQRATDSELRQFVELGQSVMRDLEALPCPVVAVLQGFAIGGGLELALACDLIIASTRAKLGQAEVLLGLIPGFGGTQRLQLRCGVGAARRLIFTGETVTAEEAHRIGIVDWLVEPENLDATAEQVCRDLAARGPMALAAAKQAIQQTTRDMIDAGLAAEVDQFVRLFRYQDTQEGLSAFIEKRKPQFTGN